MQFFKTSTMKPQNYIPKPTELAVPTEAKKWQLNFTTFIWDLLLVSNLSQNWNSVSQLHPQVCFWVTFQSERLSHTCMNACPLLLDGCNKTKSKALRVWLWPNTQNYILCYFQAYSFDTCFSEATTDKFIKNSNISLYVRLGILQNYHECSPTKGIFA